MARQNAVAKVTREAAVVESVKSGVHSTREQAGLISETGDRSDDFYVTNNAGCSDTLYTSTALDSTIHAPWRQKIKMHRFLYVLTN